MEQKWRLDRGQIEVVDDEIAKVLRGKTPAQRLAAAFAANRTTRLRLMTAIALRHPDWTEASIRAEVARRMLHGTK